MTMTDATPATAPAPDTVAAGPPTLADRFAPGTHHAIGRLWIAVALIMGVAASVIGVLLGIEGASSTSVDLFGGVNSFFQYWSLFRAGLALLVVAPLFIGLATAIVPLQIGATNIAFPRASVAAFWGWVAGAVILVVSVIVGGGWGALDGVDAEESDAIALTLLGTGLVVVSLLLASLTLVATIVALRTRGMTLVRVPLFTWSMLVAGSVWLFTLPVLLANLVLMYVDLQGPGPFVYGNPESAVAEIDMWSQVSWVFGQPQIYAFAIPVLGLVAGVVPTLGGVRQTRHSTMVALIGLFGLLSIGAWVQPAFYDATDELPYIAFGIAAVLPVAGVLGGVFGSAAAARRNLVGLPLTAFLGALGAVTTLFAAVVSGALLVIEPFDLAGTSAVGGVLLLTLGSGVVAAVSGLWYWAPKLFGTTLSEGLGRLTVVALTIGFVVAGSAEVVAGFFGAHDLQLGEPDELIVDAINVVVAVSAVVVAGGVLLAVVAVLGAVRPKGDGSGGDLAADAWGTGQTLEWVTASPPTAGNFAEPPALVTSEVPLLDLAAADPDADAGEEES